ncbi:MAG: DNA (cytosine-5-)-methyltransferase [Firmicutes bacterium]|nr:DNA (cytosine-5-)-methyltransferase [Bacillota bacterium]
MKYKIVDLFAGIGGIRKGFELTGRFENVMAAEIDKYACQTYQHLFDEDPYNDVTSENFKQRLELINYDILLAGFPCQAFSIAGKKEGFRDRTRGTLFFDIADILERTRPRAFLLENVEGLVRHKRGQTFRIILETLVQELDYAVVGVSECNGELEYEPNEFLANSRFFGIPHNRPRVYIIGFDRKAYANSLIDFGDLRIPKITKKKPIYNDITDLLDFGAAPEFYLSQGYLDTLKKHKERHQNKGNGYGYIVINDPNDPSPYSNAILATGGSGKERNLVFDPQPGIAGLSVKGKKSPLNNEGIRLMTPVEWGKLQGFINYAFIEDGVDTFSFPKMVSKAQQYKQFGNSVTIPVIEEMAEFMLNILDSAGSGSQA